MGRRPGWQPPERRPPRVDLRRRRRRGMLLRELRNNPQHECVPVGFLDDDPAKRHRSIMGVPVLGGIADVEHFIAKHSPDVVIVSTGKLHPSKFAAVQFACARAGVDPSRWIPDRRRDRRPDGFDCVRRARRARGAIRSNAGVAGRSQDPATLLNS